ncbi:MAG: ABC transporter ATP-binding protein [Candidatus Saccharibacteria bacterium]
MNTTKQTIQLYWYHAWHYPRYVIGALFGIPFAVLVNQFLPPLILANVLTRLSRHDYQSGHIWASFGTSLVTYAALVLFGGIVAWRLVDICNWRLEGKVERDIAQRVFDHLIDQSANFHANRFSGSLVSQTNKLMGSYIRFADTTMFQVIPLFSSLVFATIILSRRAPVFVGALISFAIFYIVAAFFITKPVRKLGAQQAAAESKQTGYLADALSNVMAIKSFSGGKFERKQFAVATVTTESWLLRMMRASQRQQATFGTLINVISAMSLAMAVISVMEWHANIATVFLILNYTASITGQLFSFSNNSLRSYNRALGDAEEMVKILQIDAEIKDPAKPQPSRIAKGAISFDNVTFAHDGADGALFNNLTLDIKPGEKIGLVGHSGSGKTTLTRLLLRFSDIDNGAILLDGQNIMDITQDDLRKSIAYVPQEPLLFHRSLRENIAYGAPNATEQEIIAAARKAHAHEFIELLPEGYETLVGERGVKLSGGQRQRIAIARAILKQAPILVLDEATSALDSESELLIQASLQELMKKRTAIVIAHRLSTIQKMDRILVMEQGAVIEQGSHTELVKQKGIYAQLWAHQSGGFIEE